MAAWSVVGGGYSKFYRATGELLFGSFKDGGVVRFSQSADNKDNTNIIAYNRFCTDKNGEMSRNGYYHNTRTGDYMYTVFLAALILAAPLSLKRKVRAIVLGFILMQVFVIFHIAIIVIKLLSDAPVSLLILTPRWKDTAAAALIISNHVTTGFIVAFFIWILVSFRQQNWAEFVIQKKTKG